jgi:hypothetical protein
MMMKKIVRVASLTFLAIGCSKQPTHQPQRPAHELANAFQNETAAPIPPPGTGPDARTPLAQPTATKPTIDPKSSEAAEELVRHFAALLNGGKFDEAYMLLGPGAPPRTQFDARFRRYSDLNVTLGTPGDQEGAAGSIYLSVPLKVAGSSNGKHLSRSATAILRRVNDVPGSTEAQRHWHIERIDWGGAA